MSLLTAKMRETSAAKPVQKFEGHTDGISGIAHLTGGEQIITCSGDSSLRVWNLKSGKQIGKEWRDGESGMNSLALSPNGKKVVSGSKDGAVRLWDIDTGKVIAKWTGHTDSVWSVCWSRNGRRVVSGSWDGTARQWDAENGETILAPIETGHTYVETAVYSPDTTMFATGGFDDSLLGNSYSVKIWDSKTGGLVATLKGHTNWVNCLAWTPNGKTLISGSSDDTIRTWNTKTWMQIAVLDEHTSYVDVLAISLNGRILASASYDQTVRLWNLDNGQPIGLPLEQANSVRCMSFSDGNLLATGTWDHNAYIWDVATIVKKAGFDELLSDPKADKSAPRVANITRRPVQQRQATHRVPPGFFDVPPHRSHSSPPSRFHSFSSTPQGSTFLGHLFHRSPSDAHDTSSSSPLNWAQTLLKRRGRNGEGIELHGRGPAVVEVPCAQGKRRNASAREKHRKKPLSTTTGISQPPKSNATQQSSGATQPAVSKSSAPHAMIRHAGLWTRFWLFIGCLSPEYTDGCH